jgi:glycosyltransferase involved in cell wall biosynthesis
VKPAISVITACKNSAGRIGVLSKSLARQSYSNFEWIVVDGASNDGTDDLMREFAQRHPWLRYVSEPDCGIYHAINKAIGRAEGEYYVVAGDNDEFSADALGRFAELTRSADTDVVFAHVRRGGRVIGGFHPRRAWVGPSRVFASSHSIGTLIRRSLHERFGQYSPRFPLLADVFFLKTLLLSRAVRFAEADFIAGTFAEGGATTTHQLRLLAENWEIQMLTERHPWIQTMLFFGKVLVRFTALSDELRIRRRSLPAPASSKA